MSPQSTKPDQERLPRMMFYWYHRTIAYTITTQGSKYRRGGRYRDVYIPSQNKIRQVVSDTMQVKNWRTYPKTPLRILIVNFTDSGLHTSDSSNLLKACEDALQGKNLVYANDAWLDTCTILRYKADKNLTVAVIEPIENCPSTLEWLTEVVADIEDSFEVQLPY